jgi:hypothetical protein
MDERMDGWMTQTSPLFDRRKNSNPEENSISTFSFSTYLPQPAIATLSYQLDLAKG